MPIPRIIHFTVQHQPSSEQLTAIEEAKRLHPDWKVLVWQDPVLPEGFRLSKYWSSVQSGAQLADLIRIEVVLNYGGIYLDSDIILHRSLDQIASSYNFFVVSENGRVATNAAFGSSAGHPALAEMVDILDKNPPDWTLPPNVTTGPWFFTKILKWRNDISILPRETFYPYNWNEKIRPAHPFSYGTHQWYGSWKDNRYKLSLAKKRLQGYLNPLNIMLSLVRRCERWMRSNERTIKLLSGKVRTYSASETLVTKTIHGHSIILSGADHSITPTMAQNGYYELREELFLKRVLRGGDYFIDVGANVGSFSLLAASIVGPFGRVYAYEPNPTIAEMLRNSAAMNWMHDRLLVSIAGVGDRRGDAILRFNPSRAGDATLSNDTQCGTSARTVDYLGDVKTVRTPIVTLDSEFPCDLPIKFLKIDAEGYELHVLRGAKRLLALQCIDYVMLEAAEEVTGAAWPDLLTEIQTVCAYGYTPYTLDQNGRPIMTNFSAIINKIDRGTRNLILMRNSINNHHSFGKNKG